MTPISASLLMLSMFLMYLAMNGDDDDDGNAT